MLAKSIVLTAIFLSFCVALTSQISGENYYKLAEQNWEKGKLKKAWKYYYKAAEIDKVPKYYVKAAESYFLSHNNSKDENIKKTLDIYNKSFKLSPWNNDALLSRAKYFNYLPRYSDALRDIDSLLMRNDKITEAYLLKAEIFLGARDTVKCFDIYKEALAKVPESEKWEIYNYMAYYSYYRNDWQACIDYYLLSKKTLGFKFYSYCFLASAYYNLGKKDDACYYYRLCDKEKYPKIPANYNSDLFNNCK